jgi:tyrosinase
MPGSMVYRLRVAQSSAAHMADFREAMAAIQGISDNRGYTFIAGFHGAPGWYCWHHQASRRTARRAELFLPWHRAYLWWLEQALQDQKAGVAVPWWDWTKDRHIPTAYNTRKVGGAANPLYNFRARVPSANPPINHVTTRRPGSNPLISLPTAAEAEEALSDTDWTSFSDRVEDLHDRVHGWVSGDMGDVTTAAYDPVFFAHHCMIDRLWYLWQVRHGVNTIPGEMLDLSLVPFGKRVRDVLDVQAMGYEYADTAASVQVGGHH